PKLRVPLHSLCSQRPPGQRVIELDRSWTPTRRQTDSAGVKSDGSCGDAVHVVIGAARVGIGGPVNPGNSSQCAETHAAVRRPHPTPWRVALATSGFAL